MTVPMAMLALLDAGPTHGFDLKQRYDALLGQERELKFGQVYATLQRLERDGLVAGVGVEAGAGADRKVYAITDHGVRDFESWLDAPVPPASRPAEVFARVVLALASGRDANHVLDTHRRVYLDRMRALTASRGEGDVVDRLARDYEAEHLQADLRWIELASSRLAASRPATPNGRWTMSTILEGRGLTHSFGSTTVLDGVDFAITPGEVVAVMGPSGSGKSTLLHLLGRLLRPTAGEVWLDGRRLDAASERARSAVRLQRLGLCQPEWSRSSSFLRSAGRLMPT